MVFIPEPVVPIILGVLSTGEPLTLRRIVRDEEDRTLRAVLVGTLKEADRTLQ
jgi:hypothetical protein